MSISIAVFLIGGAFFLWGLRADFWHLSYSEVNNDKIEEVHSIWRDESDKPGILLEIFSVCLFLLTFYFFFFERSSRSEEDFYSCLELLPVLLFFFSCIFLTAGNGQGWYGALSGVLYLLFFVSSLLLFRNIEGDYRENIPVGFVAFIFLISLINLWVCQKAERFNSGNWLLFFSSNAILLIICPVFIFFVIAQFLFFLSRGARKKIPNMKPVWAFLYLMIYTYSVCFPFLNFQVNEKPVANLGSILGEYFFNTGEKELSYISWYLAFIYFLGLYRMLRVQGQLLNIYLLVIFALFGTESLLGSGWRSGYFSGTQHIILMLFPFFLLIFVGGSIQAGRIILSLLTSKSWQEKWEDVHPLIYAIPSFLISLPPLIFLYLERA
jgi:nitrogen fixation-related uncharacterized protein